MIASTTNRLRHAASALRQDGASGLFARLRNRDDRAYDAWLEERDTVEIIAALGRLSDRQLGRIGMSHRTLGLDVMDLMGRAERERAVVRDALELVEPNRAYAVAAG